MNLLFILAACIIGLWLDVLLYRWVKRRWPTAAKVLLVLWAFSSMVTLYRVWRRLTPPASND